MKKTLFITLLFLIPFLGFSQTTKPIDGFLGIKFGSTKAAVIAAIKARGGRINKASKNDYLAFDNVHLGHRETDMFLIRFVDNKAYEADFVFKPADENHAIQYYDRLISDLDDIYGVGNSTKNSLLHMLKATGMK